MHRGVVEPVESAVGGLTDAGVVAAVGAGTHVVDHAHQPVLHCDALGRCPAHMVRDIDLSRQRHWPPILATHQIKPLQLNAKHKGRALNLILLGGRDLLLALLTLVHVLPLTEIFPSEVALQGRVNVVGLSDVQQKVHKVLESGRDVSATHASNILPHVTSENLIEGCRLFRIIVRHQVLWQLP